MKAGGNHFRNLINSQGGRFDHPEHDEAEAALDAFWLKRGVKEQAYRSRLVDMGESVGMRQQTGVPRYFRDVSPPVTLLQLSNSALCVLQA